MDPIFLEPEEVLRIHRDQIRRYGGSPGIGNPGAGLLDSAVATPKATFGGDFLHKDIFEMAAAYLFHIVQDHPFIDGNKRTGAAAAVVFLQLNGWMFNLAEGEFESCVRYVAEGRLGKEQLAEIFRNNCTRS